MKLRKYSNFLVALVVCTFSYFQPIAVAYCGEAAAPEPPPIRLAYNYCTLSYTFAYYSAEEWDAEIGRLSKGFFTNPVCYDLFNEMMMRPAGSELADAELMRDYYIPRWRAFLANPASFTPSVE